MATAELSVATLQETLKRMLLIRRAEEQVIHFATEQSGLIRGHYHVYIGQESSGVGACNALRGDDYVFTTHRNHGHVIARGGEPAQVLAEIIGRVDGYNKGRGGTFHVIAKHLGILQTSGIVGGCLPLAAGAAFSIKTRGTDQVSLCFFGDGALEEGASHEAINISSLWKLPVIFMCENNSVPPEGRKQGDYPSSSLAATQLVDVARAMNIESFVIDGSDVRGVQSQLEDLVARTRKGEGPFFVESRLTRWPGNMGTFPNLIGGQYDLAWAWSPKNGPAELRDWLAQSDPISLFARALVDEGKLTKKEVEATHAKVKEEITTAGRFAVRSLEPTPESAMDYILA